MFEGQSTCSQSCLSAKHPPHCGEGGGEDVAPWRRECQLRASVSDVSAGSAKASHSLRVEGLERRFSPRLALARFKEHVWDPSPDREEAATG